MRNDRGLFGWRQEAYHPLDRISHRVSSRELQDFVMSISSAIVCFALLLGVPAEATRLDGNRQSGELKEITAEALVIEGTSGPVTIPAADLQDVRVNQAEGTAAPLLVRMTDESLLAGEKVAISAGKLKLTSSELGELSLPTEQVHSVLLVKLDAPQVGAWNEMQSKSSQSDLLVVRKGDNLDFVGGTIGSVDETAVALIARGREVKVPRERIVGIVFSTHKIARGNPVCEVSTGNGSTLRVKSLEVKDGQARLALVSTVPLQVPVEALRSLDYALGRIVPLMKSISRQTLPPGVSEATVAVRNHAYSSSTLQKVPLKLGGKNYSDGLLVHPQTKLEFTLNRQFRKLRTVVGIDENASERSRFQPVVQVQILADGKPLWEQEVRWDAEPATLDLDMTDVKTLEIITSAADGKIGPLRHVDFADAKLIK